MLLRRTLQLLFSDPINSERRVPVWDQPSSQTGDKPIKYVRNLDFIEVGVQTVRGYFKLLDTVSFTFFSFVISNLFKNLDSY